MVVVVSAEEGRAGSGWQQAGGGWWRVVVESVGGDGAGRGTVRAPRSGRENPSYCAGRGDKRCPFTLIEVASDQREVDVTA